MAQTVNDVTFIAGDSNVLSITIDGEAASFNTSYSFTDDLEIVVTMTEGYVIDNVVSDWSNAIDVYDITETSFKVTGPYMNNSANITITTKATTIDDTDTDDEGDEQNESSGGGYIYE